MIRPILFAGVLLMTAWPAHTAEPPAFPDEAYVTVTPDGHLQTQGRRVRYWGFIGWPLPKVPDPKLAGEARQQALAKARADIDLMVNRIHDLGFNLVRNWYDTLDDEYRPGDGTFPDLVAYYFKRLDEKGIRIWQSSLNGMGTFGPEDAGIVDDPATADAWRAAVQEFVKKEKGRKPSIRSNEGALLRLFDPRLRKLAQERMRKCAQFRNLYKGGLRTSDDPQVAVWELSNEEFVFRPLFYGGWQNLPAFFRNALLAKWSGFLQAKYGDQAKLAAAWRFLLPGEDLAKGTVMLAPLASPAQAERAINDANPAVIESLKVMKGAFTRDDFTRARGEDVVEFFTKLVLDYKRDDHDALKSWGRSCRLSPLVWDSGNTFQIQSTFMHQHADAVSTCAYIKGMAHDPTHKRWPFHSGLEAPPRICWDVPWFEQSSIPNKPHFVYETQIDCRTKYRVEFPARIAAIAAIQDWDIVNWHIYGHSADASKENPFDGPLHIWHDYLGYGNDEVQCSAMKACAEIFKNGLLKPAPRPTVFTFGRKSLYDPASMDYGRSYGGLGRKMIPTCYRYGLRLAIDPAREDDTVDGPVYAQGVYEPCPVKPHEQIAYDWHKGCLIFDAPGAIGFTGFFGQYGGPVKFSNGAVIRDVTVKNPDGIAYPVTPEEGYVAITVASADGKPLAETKKACLSAVSTSFNTGYRLDLTKSCPGMHQEGPKQGPPQEFWGAYPIPGKAPVRVARVGATIDSPALDGMNYLLRDWHMRPLGEGKVEGGRLTLSPEQPVFIVELTRP